MKQQVEQKMKENAEQNVMRNIRIERVLVHVGGTADKLEKGFKLIGIITGKKPVKTKSTKRIPSLGVRPGLEVGAVVTIRKNTHQILQRLLAARENKIRKKAVADNHFSFGIKEYIEIPGMEYQRDIGIAGVDVTIVFARPGRRVALRKMRKTNIPKRQVVTKGEIIKFMEENFKTQFK